MAFCKKCGGKLDDKAVMCPKCGTSVMPNVVLNNDDNAVVRAVLPVGQSGLAIAAGYAGLFSLIPGVGLLAVVLGILALRDLKAHPEKHGAYRAWIGIILGVVFSILIGTILVEIAAGL